MGEKRRLYRVCLSAVFLALIVIAVGIFIFCRSDSASSPAGYTGSVSCRQCHEKFYKLWATSHHGLAMQPYTAEFAAEELQPLPDPISIGQYKYAVEIGPKRGRVLQTGPSDSKTYDIVHALGGRNVYYFLTPMERGRLQVLPLAFDVRRKEWFETAMSALRHFPGAAADAPVEWTDPFYTFNTSCHGCHVSQLATNYDAATDTYHTTWAEPGINCETCHGPCAEHVETFLAAASKGETPEDLKLVSTKNFTVEQTNSQCASCHAKLSPLSPAFGAGERYFDHFDLIALEHQDFYPDGRDLGENYTYTSWRMSPCVKSGQLDCMHCHTSSGRYRFVGPGPANDVCLPCHAERVANATAHTRHAADSEGNKCIACHMPTTEFARMTRSDHSMRPPAPAATLAFKSPNACNLCHTDTEEDVEWADEHVRQWHDEDYQRPVLELGNLVMAARMQHWEGTVSRASGPRSEGETPSTRGAASTHLDNILEYVGRPDRDEVIATSLIRLLRTSNSQKQLPVLVGALQKDPSPLVRAAAADVLGAHLTESSLKVLLNATRDEYRLVRIRACRIRIGRPLPRRQRNLKPPSVRTPTITPLNTTWAIST
ncbi:MAG: HEAT repeat domain-containing protein [Planctomycetota bacterium]